ncbi:UDP-glucose 4-epimerase GalE [Paenibacillus sediminis]|uniref:UDP-glucose 4-epimerase n=1 Tax=Paenibacillus sediminis TaxID=664909 RepID=A0ABS4H150_9BACL|nr:UDP-glucose 4-epimerase GalE [Paenibacillus sediminis]MBP1936248.1 UDP-glucose 4-epimerase [Paenibacillus sediminis]
MILVTGGAGYIGSHVVKQLLDQNIEVVVLDNLSTGHRQAVDDRVVFWEGDVKDEQTLEQLFKTYSIEGVIHFASSCLVGESVLQPLKYYENNVSATTILLKVMLRQQIKKLIFSSTCATYGIPDTDILHEGSPTNPVNPYGRSKLMVEQILSDCSKAYDLSFISLRYFNAAGAHSSGMIGECHEHETHLIPNVLLHLLGKQDKVSIFGTDYDTPDGTCIRDYIHVNDLADAHIRALQRLLGGEKMTAVYNLGTGSGFSVKEIIEMCEQITGKKANVVYAARRPGDPGRLVASYEKVNREMGWKPQYTLEDIIRTAWKWHLHHPYGYLKEE